MSAAPKLAVVAKAKADDAVREHHGCTCRTNDAEETTILVWESDHHVCLSGDYRMRYMTAWQARYLAARLYRLSRRIRARTEPTL